MASISHADFGADEPARAGSGLVLAGDRTREFARARRGSWIVRLLRLALPASAITLLGVYGLIVARTAGWQTSLPEVSLRKILPEDLAMNNPRYAGFGKDGSSYEFTAKTARQDLGNFNFVKLDGISGWVRQADKSRTNITAVRGDYDNDKRLLQLYEQINVDSESGLKARLTQATVMTDESLLISNQPVTVEFPSGNVRANTMTLRQKAREVSFVDSVVARFSPPPSEKPAGEKPAEAQPAPKASAAPNLFAASDQPVDITSERLDVNDTTKLAIFAGNVKAVQGEATITSPQLDITFDGEAMAGAAAPGAAAGASAATGKLRRILAKGPVEITRGAADHVTSESAEFDVAGQTGVLLGKVVMTSGEARRAESDRVDLDQANDKATLSGDVTVTQGENVLKGRRLVIDRKSGRAQMTAPPGLGAGPGRVSARMHQARAKGGQASKKAEPAPDEASGMGMANFKTDPNAPVDVEADQLDVDERAQMAVFRGEVRAAQGDFVINSAELYAHYSGEAGLVDTGANADPSKAKGNTELTRIEAKKNVFVKSLKGGQTANGDWATFDAKKNTVVVGGDVVLTEKNNMVRGTRLVIDMASGQSTIDTAPHQTEANPAGAGWVTKAPDGAQPANSGRASAVFYPQSLGKKGDGKDGAKKGADDAKPDGVDGWSATADPTAPPPAVKPKKPEPEPKKPSMF